MADNADRAENSVNDQDRAASQEQEPDYDWSWADAELGYEIPEIDTSKPSIARVYDAALGGQDNYPVDREVLEAALKINPVAIRSARVNRDFLVRGVRHLAEQGIDQFLDLGSGLPTAQNTHQVAQEVNPRARVVYVDNDPIVLAHGQALLAQNSRTRVLLADLMDPAKVLGHPGVEGFIDFSRPVGLLMVAVLHHILDEEDPAGIVKAYTGRLAPGSHLLLSHFCNTIPEAKALEENLVRSLGRGKMRSQEEITAFLDGLEPVEPGVVALPLWRPDEPVREPLDESGMIIFGGLARKTA
ncbi:SAM-dependent methyltransferase [Streptomyces aidingensis]|uniref:S-adenosyl methyltransferase n=1 Tax=Streptomyces aidingensis TaxID=910347 RepID=A0A1I1J8L8_9ACTN|nr:SAM-dependent methyltransferase [Streptomyces aidingensis]SFC44332.1 S-adenosyl methyltransferase [Streptomyces aidingensis]